MTIHLVGNFKDVTSPCHFWVTEFFLYKIKHTVLLECRGRGKGKVVPVLFFNWAPCHEGVLGERMYSSTHSELDGGEWSASRPDSFTPTERALGTYWIGGWVGSRAVLDAAVKRKITNPRWESNPRTSIVQPVAQRYTDWAITVLYFYSIIVIVIISQEHHARIIQ
jgi:hypothetical protein